MKIKYLATKTFASALVFFMVFATTAGYGFGEEKAMDSSKGIPKWRKIAVLPPDADRGGNNDMTWCGKSAIVYSYFTPLPAMDQDKIIKKGIELYDLKTGKGRRIVENLDGGSPFCNADGSVVFWRTVVIDKEKKIEKLHLSNMYTIWEFDLKTSSKRRISVYSIVSKKAMEQDRHGYFVPYRFFPYLKESLTNDIVIIGDEQNQLADLSKSLIGWRIIRMSLDPYICGTTNDWARDGGYFYFMTTDPKTGICRTAIYDANGRLKRYPAPPFKDKYRTVIIKGVYYVLDTENNLLIMTDIETGEKRIYPMPEGTKGFDISPKGELVYWKGGEGYSSGSNIYFANKIGDKQYLLEYRGSLPRFSPDGEYFYFWNSDSTTITVLKRE